MSETRSDVAPRGDAGGASPASSGGIQGIAFSLVAIVAAAAFVATLHVVAYRVPNESTMGIVQKIFYFHVPAAYAMYLGAVACFIGSCGFLVRGTRGWDAVAKGGAEVAVLFGMMVLTSGPLWAAKAWTGLNAFDVRGE